MTQIVIPDVATADDPDVAACTLAGVAHDYRPYVQHVGLRPRTLWRCVWCHAITCGDYDEPDPCWLPWHHTEAHRSRAGASWVNGDPR
jgi:hypothetical protein